MMPVVAVTFDFQKTDVFRKAGIVIHPPVLSFAAYSNTGKTTYLEKLIPCLKQACLLIAVIKHDGHDFQAGGEGKDSWRFVRVGAETVGGTAAGRVALLPCGAVALLGVV